MSLLLDLPQHVQAGGMQSFAGSFRSNGHDALEKGSGPRDRVGLRTQASSQWYSPEESWVCGPGSRHMHT